MIYGHTIIHQQIRYILCAITIIIISKRQANVKANFTNKTYSIVNRKEKYKKKNGFNRHIEGDTKDDDENGRLAVVVCKWEKNKKSKQASSNSTCSSNGGNIRRPKTDCPLMKVMEQQQQHFSKRADVVQFSGKGDNVM